MTKKELAEKLDGIQYTELIRCGIDRNIWEEAVRNRLVFVHGASDDLIEFGGAISDEGGCFDGGTVYFDEDGVCDSGAYEIEALWCEKKASDGSYISWTYETDIPHEEFKVYEDEKVYCIGIVFSLDDLK